MRYFYLLIGLLVVVSPPACEARFNVDLDVTHISRTPLYPSYHGSVEYDKANFNPRLP